MPAAFEYETAFSRNIGWVTHAEQAVLRGKRVAIAGLGGVGGIHLLTLARLGVGAFNLAEFDRFDLANFNRQAGATLSALGRPKLDVLVEMAKDINPALEIRTFPDGVTAANVEEFLRNVDVYVDGLDFFAFEARELTFAACARLRVPATTAAPLGMGVAVLNFLPGGMTFEEYFRLAGRPDPEKALRLLVGLSPALLQRPYLVEPSAVSFAQQRGPSTIMACQLCAGVAATEALKILLKRGKVLWVPWGQHFDAYRNKFVRTWRPGGNRNPLQALAIAMASRKLRQALPAPTETRPARPIEAILDLARWAPSGDNEQPWRFEIVSDDRVVVHGFDTRDRSVYDLDGRPSQIALGALLENVRIAASGFGLRPVIRRRVPEPDTRPTFDVELIPDSTIRPSELISFIKPRSVQRRLLSTRPLAPADKAALEASVGPELRIVWIEGWRARLEMARVLFASAGIRLTIPEGFHVHRRIIEWDAQFSEAKIPDQAIGLDPLTTRLMRWALQDWKRVEFLNTFLAATVLPRIQLDFLPGFACAAHFALIAPTPPDGVDDYIACGGAVQRFWLTATRLGLQVQPEMTPLIFASYAGSNRSFSREPSSLPRAGHVMKRLEALFREPVTTMTFLGRVGHGRRAAARSTRLPLARLQRDASVRG